jgi:hypothetical protein
MFSSAHRLKRNSAVQEYKSSVLEFNAECDLQQTKYESRLQNKKPSPF